MKIRPNKSLLLNLESDRHLKERLDRIYETPAPTEF